MKILRIIIQQNKRTVRVLSFVVVASFVAVGVFLHQNKKSGQEYQSEQPLDQPSHESNFYEPLAFQQGLLRQKDLSKLQIKNNPVAGIVVPHHLLASHLIFDTLNQLESQHIEKIIVIGPNHFETGTAKVLTSDWNWQTPYGQIDTFDFSNLVSKNFKIDNEAVSNEHAVGTLIPFFKYYFPDAKVMPIILSKTMSQTEIDNLVSLLIPLIDQQTVVVGSIDFSHYLSLPEAEQKDQQTRIAIQQKQFERILQMNSDYLDSPQTMIVMLILMAHFDKSPVFLRHENSAHLVDDKTVPTTSYFTIAFQ